MSFSTNAGCTTDARIGERLLTVEYRKEILSTCKLAGQEQYLKLLKSLLVTGKCLFVRHTYQREESEKKQKIKKAGGTS